MKHIFIINPKAGKSRNSMSYIPKIEAALETFGVEGEVYITKRVGDAMEFVRNKCQQDKDNLRFFACGGDGTLNEVVNGCVGFSHASVGAIPLGSGNDFVKSVENAGDFLDIVAQLNGNERKIDLIRIGSRYAINQCNIGFDASTAYNMNKFKSLPLIGGKMAYPVSVFYTLLQKIGHRMKIILDGTREIYNEMLLCVVANGRYCGGQFNAAPLARIDDGFLDICVVSKVGRMRFINLVGCYAKGEHVTSPKTRDIIIYENCKHARIISDTKVAVCIDGEVLLESQIELEVVSKAISFIVPATSEQLLAQD